MEKFKVKFSSPNYKNNLVIYKSVIENNFKSWRIQGEYNEGVFFEYTFKSKKSIQDFIKQKYTNYSIDWKEIENEYPIKPLKLRIKQDTNTSIKEGHTVYWIQEQKIFLNIPYWDNIKGFCSNDDATFSSREEIEKYLSGFDGDSRTPTIKYILHSFGNKMFECKLKQVEIEGDPKYVIMEKKSLFGWPYWKSLQENHMGHWFDYHFKSKDEANQWLWDRFTHNYLLY